MSVARSPSLTFLSASGLECLRQINKHSIIKCPFDKIAHHTSADNLPVNYAVLTALPIAQMNSNSGQGTPTTKDGGI